MRRWLSIPAGVTALIVALGGAASPAGGWTAETITNAYQIAS
jgi:hypothetical protein